MAITAPTNLMSVYTSGYGVTTGGLNREDLSDILMVIKPWDHPAYSAFSKVRVAHTQTEWPEDTFADASYAGVIEGGDFEGMAGSTPARRQNWTQIFRVDFVVSETQQAVNPAGVKNLYNYRVLQATKALAKAVESRIFDVQGGGTAGAQNPNYGGAGTSTDPRRFKPLNALEDTTNMEIDAALNTITADHVDQAMEKAFAAGIEPTMVFMSHGVKADFSKNSYFLQNNANAFNWRQIDASEKKLIRGVNMYDSEFGLLSVIPNRSIPQVTAATHTYGYAHLVDPDLVAIGTLRDIRHVPLAKTGDNDKGFVRGELSLLLRNNQGVASIKQLIT